MKEPLLSSDISVLDGHGAQTWNYYYAGMYVIMKDIIYKCYRYRVESDTLCFPAG